MQSVERRTLLTIVHTFPLQICHGLGSERTVTNSSQTVTGTATYEGFGQTVATTGSSTGPYMFAATSGYRNDGDAGLMHVGARYYDAQVGRFISRDTFLDQKPYLYCKHDPINGLDPSGHIPGWLRNILVGLGLWWQARKAVGPIPAPPPNVRPGTPYPVKPFNPPPPLPGDTTGNGTPTPPGPFIDPWRGGPPPQEANNILPPINWGGVAEVGGILLLGALLL